jgi:hypothetical protein
MCMEAIAFDEVVAEACAALAGGAERQEGRR